MSNPFKLWLRDQLVRMVSVQRCVVGQHATAGAPARDADLVVTMWAGVVIHIHVLDEALKPAKLRRIIETASDHGIPVLFIVNRQLLPAHHQRVAPDKWFVPLQALADDRVYAYTFTPTEASIAPVQFRPLTRLEVETLQGAAIPIHALRYARVSVRHPQVKGYWLLADFEHDPNGNTPPVRRTDYSAYQYSGPRYERDVHNTDSQARQTHTPSGQPVGGVSSNGQKSRLDISYELLGVQRSASREEVKAAFRKMAFQTHPDVSSLPQPVAEERFRALAEAYEFIKVSNRWE